MAEVEGSGTVARKEMSSNKYCIQLLYILCAFIQPLRTYVP
jgi:hypothetical protein